MVNFVSYQQVAFGTTIRQYELMQMSNMLCGINVSKLTMLNYCIVGRFVAATARQRLTLSLAATMRLGRRGSRRTGWRTTAEFRRVSEFSGWRTTRALIALVLLALAVLASAP